MMKICLVNVSDVDEAMRSRLRVWRNSEKVSPFFLLDQVTEEQHRAWLERNVRGEDARACVIYADQVPLGLVYLPWFDRNTRCGEIGIYLYDRAFRELRPASAVRFHERMGFVRVPEKDEVCVKSGERKRVLMYVKAL